MEQKPVQDFYEALEVSHTADAETIERVYRLLARRYHPDNRATGDARRFDGVAKAYRILGDPEKRAAYDAERHGLNGHRCRLPASPLPSEGAEEDRRIYQAILSVLYIVRRRDPEKPGVGIWDLERQLGLPENTLAFHIWFLREKGWIQRIETGALAITAAGVEAVIHDELLLRKDRLLQATNGRCLEREGIGPRKLDTPPAPDPVEFEEPYLPRRASGVG